MDILDFIKKHKNQPVIYLDFFGVVAIIGNDKKVQPIEGAAKAIRELDKAYQISLRTFLKDVGEQPYAMQKYNTWARQNINEDAFSGGWSFHPNKVHSHFVPCKNSILITSNMSHPGAKAAFGQKIWFNLPEYPQASCPQEILNQVITCNSWAQVVAMLVDNL